MHTTLEQQSTIQVTQESYIPKFIFVLQLHDGRYVIGHTNNAGRRIADINSGCNAAVKSLSVNRIVGIKDQTSERTLASVVSKFCDKYGEDQVITV